MNDLMSITPLPENTVTIGAKAGGGALFAYPTLEGSAIQITRDDQIFTDSNGKVWLTGLLYGQRVRIFLGQK